MLKLKDLLNTPLENNTYLVNAEMEDGWMPVGGLCLSMLPEEFQKTWSDVLEAPIVKIEPEGAYGREIYLTGVNANRLQDFPFAILKHYDADAQKQEVWRNDKPDSEKLYLPQIAKWLENQTGKPQQIINTHEHSDIRYIDHDSNTGIMNMTLIADADIDIKSISWSEEHGLGLNIDRAGSENAEKAHVILWTDCETFTDGQGQYMSAMGAVNGVLVINNPDLQVTDEVTQQIAAIQEYRAPALETQNSCLISTERKALLFESLIENADTALRDNVYDVLREIGMTDNEMRAVGLDLPELQVTEQAVEKMAAYVVQQVRNEKMDATQTHITVPVKELTARFGVDLESCDLAEDMFMEELYRYDEIANCEMSQGDLWIKPVEQILEQNRAAPQQNMGM